MKAKTFEAQYEVIDFSLYIDNNDEEESISVVDFVIETEDIDYIEKDFDNIFVIDNGDISYLFSGYEVTECYKVGDNLVRVICTK